MFTVCRHKDQVIWTEGQILGGAAKFLMSFSGLKEKGRKEPEVTLGLQNRNTKEVMQPSVLGLEAPRTL